MVRRSIFWLVGYLCVVSIMPMQAFAFGVGQGGPPRPLNSSGTPLASRIGHGRRYVATFVSVPNHQFGIAGRHWMAKERVGLTVSVGSVSETVVLRATRTGAFLVVVDGVVNRCAQVTARLADARQHGGVIGKPRLMCPVMAADGGSFALTVLKGKLLKIHR